MTTDSRRLGRRMVAAAALVASVLALAPGGGGAPAGALTPPPPDDAWVVAVYQDLLDRVPTTAQRQSRVGQLAAGRSRRSIADELVGSREHAVLVVDRLYRRILGHPSDPASTSYWRERLVSGTAVSTVASFVYGSPELFERVGGTAEDYVTFLYRDVLGREPDPAGAGYWADRIAGGENRTRLARSWLLTPEATGLRATVIFLDLLDRPPSGPERDDWGDRLRRLDERRIMAALVASGEYGRLAQLPSRSTRLTGGDGHSERPSISADGRVIAFASSASNLTPAGSPPGTDIFVIDRWTGRTRAITAGNGISTAPEVSSDGSTVVFHSAATNLVAGDTNGHTDVFRASTGGGPVEQLTDGDGDSTFPHTDADGTVVSFTSAATDLVDDDPDGDQPNAYVRTDGDPATVRRIDGSGFAGNLTDDGSAMTLAGSAVVEGGPPYAVPAAQLVRLAPGADPERVTVAVLANGPQVSGDGRMVSYLDLSSGPPLMGVDVATLDEEGTVTHRQEITGGRVGLVRISNDGTALMVDEAFNGNRVFATDGSGTLPYPDLPEGADLDGDGRLVVGSASGQIRLFEAA